MVNKHIHTIFSHTSCFFSELPSHYALLFLRARTRAFLRTPWCKWKQSTWSYLKTAVINKTIILSNKQHFVKNIKEQFSLLHHQTLKSLLSWMSSKPVVPLTQKRDALPPHQPSLIPLTVCGQDTISNLRVPLKHQFLHRTTNCTPLQQFLFTGCNTQDYKN